MIKRPFFIDEKMFNKTAKMDLYFIALVPPLDLRKEIHALKEEIFLNTGAKKAMNSSAHITIQRPFRREATFEEKLNSHLNLFAKKQNSFKVLLSGFGCFTPRTIFVDVLASQQLISLHQKLNTMLLGHLQFNEKELSKNITPHVTIANRDLLNKEFYRVWPDYQNRKFVAKFLVKSVFLFKHNGKNWDIIQKFLFKN